MKILPNLQNFIVAAFFAAGGVIKSIIWIAAQYYTYKYDGYSNVIWTSAVFMTISSLLTLIFLYQGLYPLSSDEKKDDIEMK